MSQHDVFISYSRRDSAAAQEVRTALENQGIHCWFDQRDLAGGTYPAQLEEKIRQSRALVVVFSDHVNRSEHVVRELCLAVDNRVGIVPFRIEDVEPAGGVRYYLCTVQRFDGFPPPLAPHIAHLVERVKQVLSTARQGADGAAGAARPETGAERSADDELIARQTELLADNPDDASAYSARGAAHYRCRRFDLAVDDFSQVIRLEPENSLAWYNRGWSQAQRGNLAHALEDFDAAIRLNPNSAAAWNSKGVTLFESGRAEKSLSDFARAIELNPDDPALHVNRGRALRELGRYAEAVAAFTAAIEVDDKFAVAFNLRGWTRLVLVEWDAALADLNEAIRLDPRYASAYTNRAFLRLMRGESELAAADAAEAVRVAPWDAGAYKMLAWTRMSGRKYREALAPLDEALRLDPRNTEAFLRRAVCYRALDENERALADCDAAREIEPGSVEVHEARGLTLMELGRLDAALAEFRTVVQMAPDRAEGHFQRGRCLEHMNQIDAALEDYGEALRLDRHHAGAHDHRAAILIRMGRDAEVRAGLDAAVDAVSWDPDLRLGRASLAVAEHRYQAALDDLNEVVPRKADDPEARELRGRCHFELGNLSAAEADLSEAIRLAPARSASPYVERSRVFAARGELERAWLDYREALRLDPGLARWILPPDRFDWLVIVAVTAFGIFLGWRFPDRFPDVIGSVIRGTRLLALAWAFYAAEYAFRYLPFQRILPFALAAAPAGALFGVVIGGTAGVGASWLERLPAPFNACAAQSFFWGTIALGVLGSRKPFLGLVASRDFVRLMLARMIERRTARTRQLLGATCAALIGGLAGVFGGQFLPDPGTPLFGALTGLAAGTAAWAGIAALSMILAPRKSAQALRAPRRAQFVAGLTWSILGGAIGAASSALDKLPAMVAGGPLAPGLIVGLLVGGIVGLFAQRSS